MPEPRKDTQERRPDSPRPPDSPEEELSLTAPAPQQRPADHGTPRIGRRVAHLNIPEQASDQEVLSTILRSNPDDILVWEPCPLPSGGIWYGWETGRVQVRAMSQKAEQYLATQRWSQTGQSVDMLLGECTRFPVESFNPAHLLLGDRTYLLYFIRGITHGNKYEFVMTCPNPECKQPNTYTYDLNELNDTVRRGDSALGTEPFRIDLPYLSEAAGRPIWVEVRFLRGVDSQNMLMRRRQHQNTEAHSAPSSNPLRRKQEQKLQRQEADDGIIQELEQSIVTVMGEQLNPVAKREFIIRLHSSDSATIKEWLREHTPGIDATIVVTCSSCGQEVRTELPITDTFFRPAKS